ncbi:ABC transporter substrate-binding protein [Pectinatus cerevisiiphilus]|uniref:Iron complex transport system substrate-binding protein n=1 Tax=Pectinatus cerevisiiphilus TaxID=86956 RepID=A0A4V2URN3_9FIRM|nr:ABC transporter substrate-binding protein [Pectinatus cerevisiiphilus]TCS77972.1 iron complex transport system substrate-binding protein [Pectinatus cerevisiiphilus]
MRNIKFIRKIIIILIAIGLAISIIGCKSILNNSSATDSTPETMRTITDMTGQQVQIPTNIKKYAVGWYAHNEVLVMLDHADGMVATHMQQKDFPWLYKIAPKMNNALSTFGDDFNLEALLARKPDVVFDSTDKNRNKLASVHIPLVNCYFDNYDDMEKAITLTADIMGGDAINRAAAYNSYLNEKLNWIKDITAQIAENDKPKVLHLQSIDPLKADGRQTIIDTWITTAGGINAASEIKGNMQPISNEQIIKWNPDIIILDAACNPDDILQSTPLANVTAVKNGKVYINPRGGFAWDRYGIEEALQIQWAAQLFHPDLYKDLDLPHEVKNFYKQFLWTDLTNEDVIKILHGEHP